ncbi:MAG: preprotein translocase subunit SecY [Spirochaetia bacterium]|jgi:preprotein translocase subunit SecY|nr:preprotein translocase subunit SecY [Spirochaetia bacterium]
MSNVVVNIFKIPDLRKRILFTLAIFVVYRIGAHIPIPGINVEALNAYFSEAQSTGFMDFFDIFAGGALKRFTIFALGIMPYISSSIIVDLLKVVFPYLEALSKEGHEGQKKLNQYIKYGTVFLCAIQSFALTRWMQSMRGAGVSVVPEDSGAGFVIMSVVAITTGTIVLMWFGEMITERGIGNGISMLIMAGIVVRAPQAVFQTMKKIGDSGEPIVGIMLAGILILVIAASILLTLGTRKIPLQYGKRMTAGGSMTQQTSQFLPLKVNAAGVIPIIFASALLMFPSQIINMLGGSKYAFLNQLQYWLSPGQIPYVALYAGLIIFFCFFYTAIRFNPTDIADNLKKYGGFIPGIRPGQNTADYIMYILNRITLSGSIFLACIAIVPDFIIKIWPEQVDPEMAYLFGGTSLLIMVGVTLDTLKQIESQLLMRHYDGFTNKRIKGRR